MTGVDWLCLATLLGLLAGLIAWQLNAGTWISRRIHAHRETTRRNKDRWTAPDYYNEQDWHDPHHP